VLLSEPNSTRALALDSVTHAPGPFSPESPIAWGEDRRTRVTLFAMNLALRPGEDASAVAAFAEDASGRRYVLKTERVGDAAGAPGVSEIIVRLSDDLGGPGDVLVWIRYDNLSSNRVRLAVGQSGGGPPDDAGAFPTQPMLLAGRVTRDGEAFAGAEVRLEGGTSPLTKTTATDGSYSFVVAPLGTYTLTPSRVTFYDFEPASRSLDSLGASRGDLSFGARRQTHTISGELKDEAGRLLSNYQIRLTSAPGSEPRAATTDGAGRFAYAGLSAGFDYTLAPHDEVIATFDPAHVVQLAADLNLNVAARRRTYAVRSRLTEGSALVPNYRVRLSGAPGSEPLFATTDDTGWSTFAGLPAGFDYTLAPVDETILTFGPSHTGQLAADLNLDIAARRKAYAVRGSLTEGAAPVSAYKVLLKGAPGSEPLAATTDAAGQFNFAVVPAGFDYTLAPFDDAVLTFGPAPTGQVTADVNLNVAASRRAYAVNGRLAEGSGPASNYGVRLTGATGFEQRTVTTDAAGRFAFAGVPAGFDYTLAPVDDTIATFGPSHTGQLAADVNLNIAATRKTYAIRGRVTDDGGGVKGATLVLNGQQRTTDETGAYAFEGLAAGLAYQLSASDPDHTYGQPARTIDSLLRDEQLDFSATARFVLGGRVTDASGRGIFGIFVSMTGKKQDVTYTDADGKYSFVVTSHGDYTLTPSQYQGFYTFSPAVTPLTNVGSSRTSDFGATLSHVSSPSYVLEFDGQPKDVDYSITVTDYTNFWPENVDLGHFFWELWAMPGNNASGTYMMSDGYGGAHAILFGVGNLNSSEPGRFQLFGNIWNGGALTYFHSDEGPAPGEWGHFAAGWDGQYLVIYFNGVPVGRTKWAGPRITPGPGGGGGRLYIGGSNHSNFDGRIAQLRGYEDANPREQSSVYSTFRPETVFSVGGNLMSWYFRPDRYMADLSLGYRNIPHSGAVRGWSQETFIYPCFTCPKPEFVIDPTAPNFADPEHPGTPPAPVAPPAPAPAGALVFDSFARRNSTYALGGAGGLGSTEGGTKGVLAWRTNVEGQGPQPFGILNGRAVLLANSRSLAWVDAGAGFDNFDVSVVRRNGAFESGRDTGLSFRVVDSNNYFFAYTTEGADPSARLLTVGYYSNGQRTTLASGLATPANWTTLRVKTNAAGLLEVYAEGTKVYSAQTSLMSTATGAGLYNNGPGLALANRWDNFTVLATPVN
jgi:hypothetical protein